MSTSSKLRNYSSLLHSRFELLKAVAMKSSVFRHVMRIVLSNLPVNSLGHATSIFMMAM